MSTLFLIGNGFDLNCGMKTAYRDIYPGYVSEPSDSTVINNFKKSISAEIDTWGDFEMAMADYAGKLQNENELLECVRDFSVYTNDYLLKQEEIVQQYLSNYEIRSKVSKEMLYSFQGFYLNCNHNVDEIMHQRNAGQFQKIEVISFNYTSVFDVIFNYLRNMHKLSNLPITHIHGILQEDPFLGIDNEHQLMIDYPISKRTKRGFIKPYFNECFDHGRVQCALDKICLASTICTYGLSLGDSDLTWRNELLSWLQRDDSHHLFIYDYQFVSKVCRTISERMDIEDGAKEELLLKWGIEPNEDLLEHIHIPIGKNIFNIHPYFR